ncbi:tyrosine-protein phosphatase [Streptomyces sp. NPDC006879]|uniref:tyrosine-protein phosphatase n=1 Tax=Streptomyces sp. NPDC006879 TaxID=3364767 RepID=UPI00369995CA
MSSLKAPLVAGVLLAALAVSGLPQPAGAVSTAVEAVSHHPGESSRQIVLEGAVNVRDLGGHLSYTGGRVRTGQVYRADGLSRLTDADVTALAALELREVVDFRVALEVQYEGADRLPAGLTATSRPVSDLGLFDTLVTVISSADPEAQERMLGGGRAQAYMRDIYRTFVTDPRSRAQFSATLRELADGSGPLLFHCTSGKDRTGWLSYVLLRALGVPNGSAERDYLASNTYRAASDAQLREALRRSGRMQDPDLLIPLQEVRQDYLDAAKEQMEQQYGGFFGYLTGGLGLDLRTLGKLQSRLVR